MGTLGLVPGLNSYLRKHGLVLIVLSVIVVAFAFAPLFRGPNNSPQTLQSAIAQFNKGIQFLKEPISLSTGNLQFSNGGHILVHINVTDTSRVDIIQVDGNIGPADMGACYLNLPANQTSTCLLGAGPAYPVSCADLGVGPNYTLNLKAIFANGRAVTETYPVTASQLGCD